VLTKLRRCFTYSRVVATLALFVALGGTSAATPVRDAAKHLISGKSIKNNSISSTDIKNNSVKSTDVKNGALLKKDFKAGQLPAGARGPAGPAGGTGRLTYVRNSVDLTANQSRTVDAVCPPGQYATGGSVQPPTNSIITNEGPDFATANRDRGEWMAFVQNGSAPDSAFIVVICAPGPQPVAPL
jgi:hypothetical protein